MMGFSPKNLLKYKLYMVYSIFDEINILFDKIFFFDDKMYKIPDFDFYNAHIFN